MRILGNLLLFACLLAALPALAAEISLGDLTFHYSPASWRIEASADGLVATCLQADCAPAVVEISRIDGEDGCTKEAMNAGAALAFPAGKRSYVNMVRAGRFALILAESHEGPDLASPQFVLGCVPWQGSEYRFAMRPETVGKQSWIGGALHYLVSRASAPEPPVETVRLGDVAFAISTETWLMPGERGGDGIALTCRLPACEERGRVLSLSVHTGPCPDVSQDSWEMETTDLPPTTPDGLAFRLGRTVSGCRNRVPPAFHACATHDGRSYRLSTFVPPVCRTSISQIPERAVLDILNSARIVRPD